MKLLLSASLAASVLGGTGTAQVWSPHPALGQSMGHTTQYHFGDYSTGRFQFVDGNFRKQVLVLAEIAVRPAEDYKYTYLTGMGRTWNSVTIDVAPADIDKAAKTFAANVLSTPTRCYHGAMTWPTLDGVQANPQTRFPIRVPLTTPYIHPGNGTHDFVLDFQMTGGILASRAQWFDHSPPPYVTEGYKAGGYLYGRQRQFTSGRGPGCIDPRLSQPATATMTATRFGKAYSQTQYRDKLVVGTIGLDLGPGAAWLNVVDFAVNPAGVPYGTGCENVYVLCTAAALYFTGIAFSNGSSGPNDLGFTNGLQQQPAFNNVEIYSQFAWFDSRTGAVKLTNAASAAVPHLLYDYAFEARRAAVFGSGTGPSGVLTFVPIFNPVFRYR